MLSAPEQTRSKPTKTNIHRVETPGSGETKKKGPFSQTALRGLLATVYGKQIYLLCNRPPRFTHTAGLDADFSPRGSAVSACLAFVRCSTVSRAYAEETTNAKLVFLWWRTKLSSRVLTNLRLEERAPVLSRLASACCKPPSTHFMTDPGKAVERPAGTRKHRLPKSFWPSRCTDRVWLPILLVVSSKAKAIFPCPRSCLVMGTTSQLWSSRSASAHSFSTARLNHQSGACPRAPLLPPASATVSCTPSTAIGSPQGSSRNGR